MKKNIYRVLSAAVVGLWLWVIFVYSAQPAQVSLASSGGIVQAVVRFFNPGFDGLTPEQQAVIVSSWQIIVRKTAHFCEYAMLGFLTANAVCTYKFKWIYKGAFAVAFSVVSAAFDEFHQTFVPGRGGRFLDVLLDSSGAVFGVLCFALLFWIIKKIKEKRRKRKNDTQTDA